VASAGTGKPDVGYRFPNGGFMGTYSVNSQPTFCIDLNGQGPSTASGFTAAAEAPIRKQVGWTADHKGGNAASIRGATLTDTELGQLAYLTDRYAATPSPITATAAEHFVRGLTTGDKDQTSREAVRWAEAVKARPAVRAAFDTISAEVSRLAGPYRVTATWSTRPTTLSAGLLTVQVKSKAGTPMPGVPLVSSYTALPVPRVVADSTDASGTALVTIPVTSKGTLGVTVIARDLPSFLPLLYVPKKHTTPRTLDYAAQRTIGKAPRVNVTSDITGDIVAAAPTVTTQAAPASAAVGDQLTDTLTLKGTAAGYHASVVASLWGPFDKSPTAKSCATPATPAKTVTVDVSGDGNATTPAVTVAVAGYYTWTEALPESPLQNAVNTPCGAATQTMLVTAKPTITLSATGAHHPGDTVAGTVTASGMLAGFAPKAIVTLYGPFSTTPSAADCTSKTKGATTTLPLTGDGTYSTPDVALPRIGYYTWTLAVPGNTMQPAVNLACGYPTGRFVVARDDVGALTVTQTGTTGATAPSGVPAAKGPVLTIASQSIAAALVSMSRAGAGLAVPANAAQVGQFDEGAMVGDLLGTIILAGRPSDASGAAGGLLNLSSVTVGAAVTLTDVGGKTQKFVVDSVTILPRTQDPAADLFTQSSPLRLVILSTTGMVTYGAGLVTYLNHVIVVASPA
jgi:hypothetical protein